MSVSAFDPALVPLTPIFAPEIVPDTPDTSAPTSGPAIVPDISDTPDTSAPVTSSEDSKPIMGGDDEMQFNVEQEDDAGDQDGPRGDANGKQQGDAKRMANRGEEMSVPPEGNQVMIRTIPPDIGRMKLEEVRFFEVISYVPS